MNNDCFKDLTLQVYKTKTCYSAELTPYCASINLSSYNPQSLIPVKIEFISGTVRNIFSSYTPDTSFTGNSMTTCQQINVYNILSQYIYDNFSLDLNT